MRRANQSLARPTPEALVAVFVPVAAGPFTFKRPRTGAELSTASTVGETRAMAERGVFVEICESARTRRRCNASGTAFPCGSCSLAAPFADTCFVSCPSPTGVCRPGPPACPRPPSPSRRASTRLQSSPTTAANSSAMPSCTRQSLIIITTTTTTTTTTTATTNTDLDRFLALAFARGLRVSKGVGARHDVRFDVRLAPLGLLRANIGHRFGTFLATSPRFIPLRARPPRLRRARPRHLRRARHYITFLAHHIRSIIIGFILARILRAEHRKIFPTMRTMRPCGGSCDSRSSSTDLMRRRGGRVGRPERCTPRVLELRAVFRSRWRRSWLMRAVRESAQEDSVGLHRFMR